MQGKRESQFLSIIQQKDEEIESLKLKISFLETNLMTEQVKGFYEDLIAKIPGNIYWMNTKNEFLGCNDQQARLANLKNRREIIGKTNFDMPWKDQAEDLNRINNLVMQTGRSIVQEEKAKMLNEDRFYLSHKVPLKNEKDEIVGLLGVSLDIDDLKKLENNLAKAKDAAEAANKAKSEFIANISHDIRTPLSGIIGLSNILKDEAPNETIKEYASMLNTSGEQLLSLLNNVLELLSTQNLSRKKPNLKPFRIREMLDNIFELQLPSLKLKSIDFKINMDPKVPDFVISDKEKVYRILLNILSNSIKFTQDGYVTIDVNLVEPNQKKMMICFKVTDTGIGIPQKDIKKVFDQFYRATPSYEGNFDGYGIGLNIVRKYLEILQGNVDIFSEEGKGTTFSLIIPMKKISRSQASENSPETTLHEEYSSVDIKIKQKNEDAFVLLVEDNFIAQKIATSILTKSGCRVMQTNTSTKALKLCQQHRFDFILSDIGLPDFSGFVLATKIHEYEEESNLYKTPIIGISAHAQPENVKEAIQSGMLDLTEKPLQSGLVELLIYKYGRSKSKKSFAPVNSSQKIQDKNKETQLYTADLPESLDDLFNLSTFPTLNIEEGVKITGSEEMLVDVLNLMVKTSLPQDLEDMMNAHNSGDWDKTQRIAHKIKGGAVYVGAIKMKIACQYFERYWKTGQREMLEKLYVQTCSVIKESMNDFKSYLYLL